MKARRPDYPAEALATALTAGHGSRRAAPQLPGGWRLWALAALAAALAITITIH